MSALREAAQQALEALEEYAPQHGRPDDMMVAITALRAALAQEQAEPEGSVCARCGALAFDPVVPQAEPVQTPVAWMSDSDVGFDRSEFGATPTVPLYTAPPQRTMVPLTDEEIDAEWHELDGEASALFKRVIRKFARAIEKASWEKNHG